ncbi:MAG: hypothetical protein WA510_01560 [Acidobacteriaceae bacterium]
MDITAVSGVRFVHQAPHTSKKYLIETMGPGVALFECDGDRRLDIFLVNGAPFSDPTRKSTIPQKAGPKYWNRLFHHTPEGKFEDITEKAVCRAPAIAWELPRVITIMTAKRISA